MITPEPIKILLVEDSPGDARLIVEALAEVPQIETTLKHVELLSQAIEVLSGSTIDVILLDLSLPDTHGAGTVERIYTACPQVPIVIVTDLNDEEFAVTLIGKRAQDYLIKGEVDGKSLVRAIRYAIERKRAETYRLALEVERERARLFKQFTTDVSHDLRTPLTIIHTGLALLRLASNSEAQFHYLERVEMQATRIQSIIEDYFTLSALEIASASISFESIDLKTLLEEVCEHQQALVLQKQHQLRVSLETDPLWIRADKIEFMQALKQILVNALNYTPDSGAISVKAYRQDQQAVVAIADNGIGIRSENLPHLYERFYRADKARSAVTGGSGLGLSIAQKIVE
ncbi:MAG: ATP-binding protein, partial [Chloroflexota bacterium]